MPFSSDPGCLFLAETPLGGRVGIVCQWFETEAVGLVDDVEDFADALGVLDAAERGGWGGGSGCRWLGWGEGGGVVERSAN